MIISQCATCQDTQLLEKPKRLCTECMSKRSNKELDEEAIELIKYCDEVFSGLSMSEIASMVPLVERLRMKGVTLLMIEHRLRELFSVADRVVVIDFGVKIAEGKPEQVMQDEKVRRAYRGEELEL